MTANRKISFFLKTPLLSECGGIMVSYCDIYKCWSQYFSIWRWRNLGSKKKLIKTNTIFLIIYRHHSSSPRQRLRRCRGRGALQTPAARAGGKPFGAIL